MNIDKYKLFFLHCLYTLKNCPKIKKCHIQNIHIKEKDLCIGKCIISYKKREMLNKEEIIKNKTDDYIENIILKGKIKQIAKLCYSNNTDHKEIRNEISKITDSILLPEQRSKKE